MTPRPVTDDDLTILRLIHAALRRDVAWLAAALERPFDTMSMSTLRRRWAGFAQQLHDHHTAEDELIWPVLRDRAGRVADPVLAAMTAEHATLDPALTEVEHRLGAITGAVDDSAVVDLRRAVARVRELLERHLTHEEAAAIPLVRQYLTGADLEHVAAVQRRKAGLRGARVFLPWVLDGASAADSAHVLGDVPAPLRWMLPRWQRQHSPMAQASS
jgi:hemerythrin-like domain-containing protein